MNAKNVHYNQTTNHAKKEMKIKQNDECKQNKKYCNYLAERDSSPVFGFFFKTNGKRFDTTIKLVFICGSLWVTVICVSTIFSYIPLILRREKLIKYPQFNFSLLCCTKNRNFFSFSLNEFWLTNYQCFFHIN